MQESGAPQGILPETYLVDEIDLLEMQSVFTTEEWIATKWFNRVGSLGICTVLIVSLTGSLTLVMKSASVPTNSPVLAHMRTGELADRVLSDLAIAQSFTINTATDVEFKVPSRDANNTPDTIRYQWTGSPSNQLLRSYNGGSLNLFAADVKEFGLSYLTRSMGPPPPPAPVESAEVLLMEHNDAPSGSFSSFNTSTSNWGSQWFNPSLSPDAVSWKITRVQCSASRANGTSATFQVRIQSADPATNQPLPTVLSTLTATTATLPTTTAWVNFDIPDAANLSAETGYCLVIAVTASSTKYPILQFESNGTPMPSRTHWMTSSTAGTAWTLPELTKDMRFRIYGTITTQPL